jgi:hypothetical protein
MRGRVWFPKQRRRERAANSKNSLEEEGRVEAVIREAKQGSKKKRAAGCGLAWSKGPAVDSIMAQ